MKGGFVDEYRTIQLFLSDAPGIYEVSSTKDNKSFKCNCPGFTARNKCKHVAFVQEKIEDNDGVYPTQISARATKEEAEEATLSNDTFREFLIKYGKIEVC